MKDRIMESVKEIMTESTTVEEQIHWRKKLDNYLACGTVRVNNDKQYIHRCNEKWCPECQKKATGTRFWKMINEIMPKSSQGLKKGYKEVFITLNYDYLNERVKEKSLEDLIAYFKKLMGKFWKQVENKGLLGYISRIEIPFNESNQRFQIHSHSLMCVKELNVKEIREIWESITEKQGTLHCSAWNQKMYFESVKSQRTIPESTLKRMCSYLSKPVISLALENKGSVKEVVKNINDELKGVQFTQSAGIYNLSNYEKGRKKEKSRMFIIKNFDRDLLDSNDDNCEIWFEDEMMVVKYRSDNNCVAKIEQKFGGDAAVLKGRGVWKDALENGNWEQYRAFADGTGSTVKESGGQDEKEITIPEDVVVVGKKEWEEMQNKIKELEYRIEERDTVIKEQDTRIKELEKTKFWTKGNTFSKIEKGIATMKDNYQKMSHCEINKTDKLLKEFIKVLKNKDAEFWEKEFRKTQEAVERNLQQEKKQKS